jgi:hypothetical protein
MRELAFPDSPFMAEVLSGQDTCAPVLIRYEPVMHAAIKAGYVPRMRPTEGAPAMPA